MSKEVLAKYIVHRLESGEDFLEIKKDLLARGYSENEINEAKPDNKKTGKKVINNNPPTVKSQQKETSENRELKEDEEESFLNDKTEKKIKIPKFNLADKLKQIRLPKLSSSKQIKKSNLSFIRNLLKNKIILFSLSIVFALVLLFTLIKTSPFENLNHTLIVGSVYFIMLAVVTLIKSLIINNVFLSTGKQVTGGIKRIFLSIVFADMFMLYFIPLTFKISIFIPLIIGGVFYTIIIILFEKLNIHEIAISVITWFLLNFLILFLINTTITPEVILRLFGI